MALTPDSLRALRHEISRAFPQVQALARSEIQFNLSPPKLHWDPQSPGGLLMVFSDDTLMLSQGCGSLSPDTLEPLQDRMTRAAQQALGGTMNDDSDLAIVKLETERQVFILAGLPSVFGYPMLVYLLRRSGVINHGQKGALGSPDRSAYLRRVMNKVGVNKVVYGMIQQWMRDKL